MILCACLNQQALWGPVSHHVRRFDVILAASYKPETCTVDVACNRSSTRRSRQPKEIVISNYNRRKRDYPRSRVVNPMNALVNFNSFRPCKKYNIKVLIIIGLNNCSVCVAANKIYSSFNWANNTEFWFAHLKVATRALTYRCAHTHVFVVLSLTPVRSRHSTSSHRRIAQLPSNHVVFTHTLIAFVHITQW